MEERVVFRSNWEVKSSVWIDWERSEASVYDAVNRILDRVPFQRVLWGNSPENRMTRLSGGVGPDWDRNTVLFQITDREYVFVGCKVVRFRTRAPIQEYLSPVGNNAVPYPYAKDSRGDVYLMLDGVSFQWDEHADADTDPYTYYYANVRMEGSLNVGEEPFQLLYKPDPWTEYERIRHIVPGNPEVFFVSREGETTPLTKNGYVDMCINHAERLGFRAMEVLSTIQVWTYIRED